MWLVTDGGFTKRPFVKPLMAAGITHEGRLRKDSGLRDLPPVVKKKGRGRPRVYGLNRVALAKRAAHPGGWSAVTCSVYGRDEAQTVKTFLATHATFGGPIRVVLVKEPTGPQFFDCTDVDAGVREIVEAFANRSTIEQVFHDVTVFVFGKTGVWGSGEQQVRNLWTNLAAWHLNLWQFTLTERWAWHLPARQLTDRRPSHADRRTALQTQCLWNDFSQAATSHPLPEKFRNLLQRLLRIAL